MPHFDPRIFTAAGGVLALVVLTLLWRIRRVYPRWIHGLNEWMLACAVWAVAAVLLSGQQVLPDALSVVLADGLLLAGALMAYAGLRYFFAQPMAWRRWIVVCGAGLLGVLLLTYAWPSPHWREHVLGLPLAALCAAAILTLRHHAERRTIPPGLPLSLGWLGLVMLIGHGFDSAWVHWCQVLCALALLLLSGGLVVLLVQRLSHEMQRLGCRDGLTQTLRRDDILRQCEDELQRAQRHRHELSLMVVELHKPYRGFGTHNRLRGDAVMRHFAQRAQAALRRSDRIGRLSRTEFLVLLPHTCGEGAMEMALRLHGTMGTGHPLNVRLSIGIAPLRGEHDTARSLLARADRAHQLARDRGQSQTQVG